jgi:sulfur carrier protein ThiS
MIRIIYREHEFELRPGMALLDALQKINILPETIISTRNGEVITEDEILFDGDVVKLISVISGG